jgi:hypothetical protein
MNDEKAVTKAGPAAEADESNTNPYFADALERRNRLRAILDGFPKADLTAPPLTPAERRMASMTTVEGLEQAALFAEEEPNVGGELADVKKLRDIINFLLAYEGVREQAVFVFGDLDQTVVRAKLDGAKYARGLYRMAKAYAASAPAQRLNSKVAVMKQLFGVNRRTKPAVAPSDAETVKK